jgi:magnesium chelatase family protein
LLDRIDIHVDVQRVDYDKLMGADQGENSLAVRERVERAREGQRQRFAGMPDLIANTDMRAGDMQKFCVLTGEARTLLELSVRRMQLSARAYHRVLKLSRTIADLAGCDQIEVPHVAEAIQYRPRQQMF